MNIALDSFSNNEDPLVSIIAIAYNHASFLEETLDSVVGQTYKSIELIIVDAFSNDESVVKIKDWIQRNPEVKVKTLFQSETKKITENANDALKLADGEYYQILSCDDVLMPGKIASQIITFQNSDDRLGVVYSDAVKIDEKGVEINAPTFFQERDWQEASQLPSGMIFPMLLMDYFIVAPTVLVKKEYAIRVGGYNPESMMEDLDLFLKMAQRYSIKGLFQVDVKYRVLETSLLRSTNAFNKQSNRLKIYADFIDQKGEWDRYITYQFLLAHRSKSLMLKLFYFFHSQFHKILKFKFKINYKP
ncbi:Glycosyl transferase family 2 [Algoriphagus locisalis]|uniref:Glycosyl transferase family 2 n=1 Tax=Algoriphagus locisalis TaxID=305507 RepID=A0A1I6XPI6_9BACT|nr:glycosyltransferase [Algoriphagus locisalis]SFT40210.1 Glycosyl transferase family 2 [Algoriphagus locisalis]